VTASTPIPILLNIRSGTRKLEDRALEESFRDLPVSIQLVEPEQLAEAVRAAADAALPIVGVAGGDGSMRTAAAVLANSGTALLPVPAGTLNHLAKRCGIADFGAAAAALRARQIQPLPVGLVGEHVFMSTLTLGEYARVLRIRERWRHRVARWPAILLGCAVTFFSLRRIDVVMQTGGKQFLRRTPVVWVGIGWGSFPRVHEALERRSSPDLELALMRDDTVRANIALVLRVGWDVLRHEQPVRDPALEVLHTRDVRFTAARPIDATADGEVLELSSAVRVTVRDDALRVVVGKDWNQGVAPT
jgi:diacylglycerol kinase family enzyme